MKIISFSHSKKIKTELKKFKKKIQTDFLSVGKQVNFPLCKTVFDRTVKCEKQI